MLYPHCEYYADGALDSGDHVNINGVYYVDSNGLNQTLSGYYGSGSMADARDWLNDHLATYGEWTLEGGQVPRITLSENQIVQMMTSVEGSDQTFTFTQSGCVEMERLSDTLQTQTGSVQFLNRQNLNDINLIEIWSMGFVLICVTAYLIIMRGILGKR